MYRAISFVYQYYVSMNNISGKQRENFWLVENFDL